ncbi:alpha-L-arabinofuranosidase 1-like isoform X2 [Nymphaea colorata]|nr:alpha-L-arabinofuranosidase 1-like isoform X2 [Nymphaea colorata]
MGMEISATVQNQTASLLVDAREQYKRPIPKTLFGIFFEEINHAGAGGLWAELVSNRGFEAGGSSTPSYISPWSIIGEESNIVVSTDRSSCFSRNIVALRMEVLCDRVGPSICPEGGVGVYNPGYWGMNIEQGKAYKLIFYVRSLQSLNLSVSLTSSNGSVSLSTSDILVTGSAVGNWTRMMLLLTSAGTDPRARLSLVTSQKGVIWLDQVSLTPMDTFKGHGFQKDLMAMLLDLKPQFVRFPGGCYVEGEWMRNAFHWKDTIGPWEERPGHFGDVWGYWTDDGLGYLELLQLAEDLDASPIWVVNIGISHREQVETSILLPFVQDVLDSIEFARGNSTSKWGSVRAAMGHPEPFQLNHVALGNEDCGKPYYRSTCTPSAAHSRETTPVVAHNSMDPFICCSGNYLKFYYAIKDAYPDMKIISNCDGSAGKLDHPADLYDFHIYASASTIFSMAHKFDDTSRDGPKVFVSEYAVHGQKDAREGTFLAALAEAGFLIGLERNSDVVEMASYAPLFVNYNDRGWESDAIVFDSWQHYGTPSYWAQQFFKESSGAFLLPSEICENSTNHMVASALTWHHLEDDAFRLKLKIVNFDSSSVCLKIKITGLDSKDLSSSGSSKTIMTSNNLMDENSFAHPEKVVPIQSLLEDVGPDMDVVLSPNSITAFDLTLVSGIDLSTSLDCSTYKTLKLKTVKI